MVDSVLHLHDHKQKISILLVTYNHEQYIERALRSIFDQSIPDDLVPVEIVVADDASTDRTTDIIRRFEGKDRRFVFRHLENQVNLGITRNYQRGFSAVTGQYAAVLEGDDYWLASDKLIRQLKVLDDNPNCMLCSSNYYVLDHSSGAKELRVSKVKGYRAVSVADLIADNIIGNFSTCMYRNSALTQIPSTVYDIKSYDWIINICVGSIGDIIFLHEPMSVYRVHGNGNWSGMSTLPKLESQLALIPAYDALTGGRFTEDFMKLSDKLHRDCETVRQNIHRRPKGPLSRMWKKIKSRVRGHQ